MYTGIYHKKNITWLILLILLTNMDCREKYLPPAIISNDAFLVVDGFINGRDTTFIKLTYSQKVGDNAPLKPALKAQVVVEDDVSGKYPLQDFGKGLYVAPLLNLNTGSQYRINIKTTDGKQYLSDFVPYKPAPAIDSISWEYDTTSNVSIFVNTHDPQNNTTYYHWKYVETWEYHTNFLSMYDYVNHQPVERDFNNLVYYCWKSSNSTNVLLGSSEKLGRDIIYHNKILDIDNGSERIWMKYSILVKQYALTKEGFAYWQNLKSSTEQLGTLFDPQPSEVNSNIHCVNNPEEPVLGYLSATTEQTKRIFINGYDLIYWRYIPYYADQDCKKLSVRQDSLEVYLAPYNLDYYTILEQQLGCCNVSPLCCYYTLSTSVCSDCREHGGTSVKPSFWP